MLISSHILDELSRLATHYGFVDGGHMVKEMSAEGFEILDAQECFRPIKFYDVGALVWFARIIEWEFPGFSVERCKDELLHAQALLEQNGVIEGRIHRFLLVCSKSARK